MQRDFVVVEEEDEYGEIILSLAATEVGSGWRLLHSILSSLQRHQQPTLCPWCIHA